MNDFDYYKKAAGKALETELQERLNENTELYNKQAQTINDIYNRTINNTERSYDSAYDENAVQKIINERQIAENMANLGLTDSGLNRTQQTAAQLSYSEGKRKIDKQKQEAIDSLTTQLAQAIGSIEQNRLSAESNLKEVYSERADSNAVNLYSADLNAETEKELAKLQQSALQQQQMLQYNGIVKSEDGLLTRDFTGSLKDNNVDVIYGKNTTAYIDNTTGLKTTLERNTNPYTGTVNKDTENGVFSNGYQPDNINGKKLKIADKNAIEYNNQLQNVWTIDGNRYYVWNGRQNKYFEVYKDLDAMVWYY